MSTATSLVRIEEITHDRVLVSPAPGEPGKMPFWHGDQAGRPVELGYAIGRLVRERVETVQVADEDLHRRDQRSHPHGHGEHLARVFLA